jgi:hypothetical protein
MGLKKGEKAKRIKAQTPGLNLFNPFPLLTFSPQAVKFREKCATQDN